MFGARTVDQGARAPDGAVETGEDRLADQKMADIQLGDFRNLGDGADAVEAKPMPGMAFEADSLGMSGSVLDAQ